ncbi:MAG: YbjN domain-containing protein [Spirulina sp. SIO3F2]|nr:YbjN domain-containing protein [Spirulina sp. SIO3F2]
MMHKLDRALNFQTPTTLIKLKLKGIELLEADGFVLGCQLMVQCSSAQHQRIEQENLFNLQSEVRTTFSQGKFQRDRAIQITLTLDPQHLEALEPFSQAETVADFLETEPQTSPLRQTISWLLLSASQKKTKGKTGYRTIWDYLDFATLSAAENPETALAQVMTQFLAESTASQTLAKQLNLPQPEAIATTQNLSQALLQALPGLLQQESGSTQALTQQITQLFSHGLETEFEQLAPAIAAIANYEPEFAAEMAAFSSPKPERKGSLLAEAIAFFEAENWSYEQLKGQPILRSLYQSNVGKWLCITQVDEINQVLTFYSIGQTAIVMEKRNAIAELLMTLNYGGVLLGNFELDFQDGELRYRTGIQVKGSQLKPALIKNVVYANVLAMEQYLPLIEAVAHGELTVGNAIRRLEAEVA